MSDIVQTTVPVLCSVEATHVEQTNRHEENKQKQSELVYVHLSKHGHVDQPPVQEIGKVLGMKPVHFTMCLSMGALCISGKIN